MSHEQLRALLEKNNNAASIAFDPFDDIELLKTEINKICVEPKTQGE